jgi:hypothetical protein
MAVNTPEHSVRIPYSHAGVPDHINDLRKQAENPQSPRVGNGEKAVPMQGQVVFESGRTPDPLEQLPENLKQPTKELIAALGNPKHPLRPDAEKAVGGFARASDKSKGISARSASREYHAPTTFFLRWARHFGVIPILEQGKGQGSALILDREKARQAAELYHEAKQQRIQPKKLIDRMSSK